MGVQWELAVHEAIASLDAEPLIIFLNNDTDDLADLFIVAYPASAHADVATNQLVAKAVGADAAILARRVALAACSPSDPDVTELDVGQLLGEQAPGAGDRHPCRAVLESDLQAAAQLWFSVCLRRLGPPLTANPHDEYNADSIIETSSRKEGMGWML